MSTSELPCVYIYSCCDDDPLKTIKCKPKYLLIVIKWIKNIQIKY